MMETENSQPTPELVKSLSACSSWWTFFKTDLFGKNYANFKGRASRREWWGVWVCFILSLLLIVIVPALLKLVFPYRIVFQTILYFFMILGFLIPIILLLLLIPACALMVRRAHDLNWKGSFLFLIFPILFLPFFKGERKDNRFGKNIY